MDYRSVHGALAMRELGKACAQRTVEACAEALLLQHAVSHYCPLATGAKSTIAAAFISGLGQPDLLATSHGDHTIKLHSWPAGKPVQVLQESGHTRTPWTVSWVAAQPGLLLTGALDGKVVLWEVASGQPLQQVETGKTIASCCLHPCGTLASYCAGNKAYMWPLHQGKPWPCLPVRLYKAKRVLRMVLVNPGQPGMLLTGELVGKDCTGSQLLQATPAQAQAVMRCNRRRAAAAAGKSAGWSWIGKRGQASWQQQQEEQQQLVGQQHAIASAAPASSSSSSTACAAWKLQQLLAGLTAGDVPAVGDMQDAAHQAQQHVQQHEQQQAQQQQQNRQAAGEEEQQLLLQAMQQAREQEAVEQQQQQQAPGSSPTSTTFLQRIGASLWSRGSSRGTSDPASAAAPTTPSPSQLDVTSAPGADHASKEKALAASIQQLLAALRQVAAAATGDTDEDGEADTSTESAAGQDELLNLALQLQQHHLCSAHEAAELCCMLRSMRRQPHAMLQMPGFDCHWGLDAAGSDILLRLCGGSAGGLGGLPNAPLALDNVLAAAAILQSLSQSCRAVQAAATAEASASRRESAAAAAELVQQLAQELAPFPASMGALQALHSRQQQQAGEEAGKPCLAVLRIWRMHAQQQCGCSAPQQLEPEQQQLVVPFVVLCSERSVGVSPCGRLLVAVVAVRPASSSSRAAESLGQLDASKEEFRQAVEYELRVMSLEAGSMGQVLAARSIAAADCLTCVQVSPTGQHVLLAYGRRSKQLSCFVAGQGSYEVWHTVLQLYRMSDLALVRQMISRDDEVNVATWHPCPGQGITYGTKAGRVRNIVACGSDDSCHSCRQGQNSAAAEATSVLQQTLQ